MNAKLFISDVNIDQVEAEKAVRGKRLHRLLPGVFATMGASEAEVAALLSAHALRIIATAKEKSRSLLAVSAATVAGVSGIMVFNESVDRPKRKMWQGGLLVEMPLATGVSDLPGVQRLIYARDPLGEFQVRGMSEAALLVSHFVAKNRLMGAADDYSSVWVNDLMKRQAIEELTQTVGEAGAMEKVLKEIGALFGMKSADSLIQDVLRATDSGSEDERATRGADALVYWHKQLVATIQLGDAGARVAYLPSASRLSLADRSSAVEMNPSFVASLMPEGVAAMVHAGHKVTDAVGDTLDIAARGARLMSNIHVLGVRGEVSKDLLVEDVIGAKLESFTSPQREFLGSLNPERMVGSHANVKRDPLAPIQSGHQEKMPAYLRNDGELCAAERGVPFTHMIKIAPQGPLSSICAMEWLGLSVFQKVGIPTEKFAIMRGRASGASPLLVVERFDIRQSADDGRKYISEDIWAAIRSRGGKAKYQTDLVKDVAPLINSIRSDDDGKSMKATMLDTVIASWLIQNEDMHSKNVSFLTTVEPHTGKSITTMSPAYDVTVNAAHDIATGRSAMPINEKYIYTVKELAEFGAAIGFTKGEVFARVKTLSLDVKQACSDIQSEGIPECIQEHPESARDLRISFEKVAARCERAIAQLNEDQRSKDAQGGGDTLVFSPLRPGRF